MSIGDTFFDRALDARNTLYGFLKRPAGASPYQLFGGTNPLLLSIGYNVDGVGFHAIYVCCRVASPV